MWLIILIVFIGFALLQRALHLLAQFHLLSHRQLYWFGSVVATFVLLCVSLYPQSQMAVALIVLGWCLAGLCLVWIVTCSRRKKLRSSLFEAVDQMVLYMKTGCSFREAFQRVLQKANGVKGRYLREIYECVVFADGQAGRGDASLQTLVAKDLRCVDREPHRAIDRLEAYRNMLRLEDRIRRKSSQISLNVRVQSFVMSCLYICLFCWVLWNHGFSDVAEVLILSVSLFGLGTAILFWLEGKRQWKV